VCIRHQPESCEERAPHTDAQFLVVEMVGRRDQNALS
jgi:hypothetical protein